MLFARFLKNCKGGVAPMLALSTIPIMAAAGAAVDYSRANSVRAAMQATLDTTGLMLAKESESLSDEQLGAKGNDYFNINFTRPEVQNITTTVVDSLSGGGVLLNLSAKGSLKTTFMGVLGAPTMTILVKTSVFSQADGFGCVLSLNPHAGGAITGQGSTSVNLQGCSLYDNSNNASALTVGGSSKISALSVGVVGGISGQTSIATTHGVQTGISPVADPYAGASFPNFSGCNETNYVGKKTETIEPGVYCGGMSFNANANVTLKPGIYYLDGGGFSANGGAKVSGDGVTLVFTKKTSGSWADATINGSAEINLTAPKTGPTAGIVIFGDRNMPVSTSFKLTGGASQYFGGAIYTPAGAISFSGGNGTSKNCTQIIGDTITFVGNSSLVLDCSKHNTKSFGAAATRIIS